MSFDSAIPNLSVYILSGGPSQASRFSSLGVAVHKLPVSSELTMLDAWCRSICRSISGLVSVDLGSMTVVLSEEPDQILATGQNGTFSDLHHVCELRRHRGTAGVVADQVLKDSDRDGFILVVEASASPVVDLRPMLAVLSRLAARSQACVLSESELGRYCGVCLFDRQSFSLVPDVGFFDLKEQFLPLLRSKGRLIESVTIAPRALRLQSRAAWLAIVEAWGRLSSEDRAAGLIESEPPFRSDHRENGVCVIESGAVVRGAVIISSIIMAGAVVESGAVVARSVIGPGAVIAAGSVVVDAVVPVGARVDSNSLRISDPSGSRLQRRIAAMGEG